MSMDSSAGLAAFLEEYRIELHRFLIARTGVEADADDLMNELWIRATSSQRGPIANAKGYLFRMADNLVLDRLRETRRRERREIDWTAELHGTSSGTREAIDPSPNAEQSLLDRDEASRLRTAIAQLPAGAARVLRMHKFDGLSHAELADRLGISKSAVEKHMAVAMTHLRRILAAEAEPVPRRLSGIEGDPAAVVTGLKS